MHLASCAYPVVILTVGAPGPCNSLHLILFSDSLKVSQNFNPVHSEILFSHGRRKHKKHIFGTNDYD